MAIVVFIASAWNGFAYDDVSLIAGDPRVHAFDLRAILTTPYWPGFGYFRPLTTLSFAWDWLLSGGAPGWFHLMNVVWNAAACVLAFLLLRILFRPPAALVGALAFAVHPVHVEAVANVVGRSELLAATFFLAACLLWVRGEREPTWKATLGAAACFALALASKEGAAVLPAALVLLDGALGRWDAKPRSLASYIRSRGPALLAVVAVLPAYLLVRFAVLGHFAPPIVYPAAEVLTGPLDRLRTALQAWPMYLRLLVFPRTLLADYAPRVSMPATTWTPSALLGLALFAATCGGGAAALVRGRRRTGLAALWFLVTILPVSNLLVTSGIFLAERTLFLPSLALAIAVAGAAEWIGLGEAGETSDRPEAHEVPAEPDKGESREASPVSAAVTGDASAATAVIAASAASAARRTTRVAYAAAALVIGTLAVRTVRRIPDWKSTDTIFEALVRDRPDTYRGKRYLGRKARAAGDLDAAAANFREAVELWPNSERLVLEAIGAEVARSRLDASMTLAGYAVNRWPRSIDARRMFAGIALDLADTAAARHAIAAGLELDPDDETLRAMQRAVGETDSLNRNE